VPVRPRQWLIVLEPDLEGELVGEGAEGVKRGAEAADKAVTGK
jgi:hypothetical protein